MKLWRRWDPRLERMPLRAVKLAKQWVIEVVPDIFAPGCDALAARIFKSIGALRYQKHDSRGRFLLRTAYPTEAAAVIRRISERERHSMGRDGLREVPSRLVLALYAETQAQLEERVALLFAPRPKCEEIALTDPAAGIALAVKEGWIGDRLSFEKEDLAAATAKGPEAVSAFLRAKVSFGHRTDGIPVDSGGLALYLSPRERIDIGPFLQASLAAEKARGCYPQHAFDWIVCAGRIGPFAVESPYGRIGPRVDDPHPMHPGWVRRIANAARDAETPFFVPYLGEWGTDQPNAEVPDARVNYDPTWAWGERGWDDQHREAKPYDVDMYAVGATLSGRAIYGHTFDQWPTSWCPR